MQDLSYVLIMDNVAFILQMERKRSDYQTLLERHQTHYSCLDYITKCLEYAIFM